MIEVGLGGRLDATNVLAPLLTITTDISYDHMDVLGETLEKIAAEKGGIIKPGVPHLLGLLPQPALRTLADIAKTQNAPLTLTGDGRAQLNPETGTLDYDSPGLKLRNLKPSLAGEHQLRNAAVVLEAVQILRTQGLRLPLHAVREGITHAHWRGRFQTITGPKQPTIILDVCHNAAGAQAFARAFAQKYPGRKVAMIVGFVQKKEHQVMFDALSPIASEYWLVPLKTHRSTVLDDLIRNIDFRGVAVRPCRNLAAAWSALVKPAGTHDIIPIIGSHYLVGEYLSRYIKA